MRLVAEGLDDADAAQGFLQPDVEIAHAGIDGPPGLRHPPAIDDHQGQHRGHDQRHDHRKLRVDPEHQRESPDKGHQRDKGILGPVMGNLADFFQVAGHARDQLAGAGAVVPPPGQARQVVEGAGAHLRLDVDAELVAPVGHDRQQARIGRIQCQQAHGGCHGQRPVALWQQVVDKGGHGQRKGQFQKARQHRAAEIQPEQSHEGPVIGKELAQHGAIPSGGSCPDAAAACHARRPGADPPLATMARQAPEPGLRRSPRAAPAAWDRRSPSPAVPPYGQTEPPCPIRSASCSRCCPR